MRLMYVDDDHDDQFLFTEAIQELYPSATLIRAYDGKEALDYLTNRSNPLPDRIFLDVNMPLVNGIECLQAIRGDSLLTNIPVTILTTGLRPKDADIIAGLGTPVIIKDSNYDAFKLRLATAIAPLMQF